MKNEPVLLPESTCPDCGYHMDAATSVDGEDGAPQAGDLSLCISCGALLEFNEDLLLVKATRETVSELDVESLEELLTAQAYIERRSMTIH